MQKTLVFTLKTFLCCPKARATAASKWVTMGERKSVNAFIYGKKDSGQYPGKISARVGHLQRRNQGGIHRNGAGKELHRSSVHRRSKGIESACLPNETAQRPAKSAQPPGRLINGFWSLRKVVELPHRGRQNTRHKRSIEEFLEPAGKNFADELVYRYLLTKGDALGGKARNLAGSMGERKFLRSLLSVFNLAGLDYRWKDNDTNTWLNKPKDDKDIEKRIKAIYWKRKRIDCL